MPNADQNPGIGPKYQSLPIGIDNLIDNLQCTPTGWYRPAQHACTDSAD